MREAVHLVVLVLQVPEDDRPSGTAVCTRRLEVTFPQIPSLEFCLFLGHLETMNAEGALLHHAYGADRDIRVGGPVHSGWPFRLVPVEGFHRVGTGGHAVAAPYALGIDLRHDPFLVEVRGAHRTDLCAGGVIAVHAGPGDLPHPEPGVLPLIDNEHVHPEHRSAHFRFPGLHDGYVVFHLAGGCAFPAPGAFLQIDHHPPLHR